MNKCTICQIKEKKPTVQIRIQTKFLLDICLHLNEKEPSFAGQTLQMDTEWGLGVQVDVCLQADFGPTRKVFLNKETKQIPVCERSSTIAR